MTTVAHSPNYTRRSSDLSKHSAEVFALAEDHPVTVTRRDGEALILMSQREAESRAQLLSLAAKIVTAATSEEGALAERMCRVFPWMFALSEQDRQTCAQDLLDAARASFATGQYQLALSELTSWEETASAIAAGLNCVDLVWITPEEPVGRP
ncbi:prevent-host-death protein [Corynebacterium riegelii]|uniref:Prevent-host-death protein n=1 Tax=Corynebacterium riegelii TaxID=156976 RepID=A0A0K1R943_9CORY|nr:prevent-host-death protein [Corynebacterium riegelii]AKV57950.1 prevent-host-death protein [Corynebacterium riegelii]MDK7180118.1 prevent-host-death protein [Corynebacterium riegelii]QQU84032.1 prevent-host-death protein [Corynebacterium riegelii]